MDTTGDGKVDVVMRDTTGDGRYDTVEEDTTGDGRVDRVTEKRRGSEKVMIDTNNDGELDTTFVDGELIRERPSEKKKKKKHGSEHRYASKNLSRLLSPPKCSITDYGLALPAVSTARDS